MKQSFQQLHCDTVLALHEQIKDLHLHEYETVQRGARARVRILNMYLRKCSVKLSMKPAYLKIIIFQVIHASISPEEWKHCDCGAIKILRFDEHHISNLSSCN